MSLFICTRDIIIAHSIQTQKCDKSPEPPSPHTIVEVIRAGVGRSGNETSPQPARSKVCTNYPLYLCAESAQDSVCCMCKQYKKGVPGTPNLEALL